ncbi:unnamed protein product [Closterium sp. Naga37s-1]|nr:unnamed protein product [Closterium sp. Naga37s-1]
MHKVINPRALHISGRVAAAASAAKVILASASKEIRASAAKVIRASAAKVIRASAAKVIRASAAKVIRASVAKVTVPLLPRLAPHLIGTAHMSSSSLPNASIPPPSCLVFSTPPSWLVFSTTSVSSRPSFPPSLAPLPLPVLRPPCTCRCCRWSTRDPPTSAGAANGAPRHETPLHLPVLQMEHHETPLHLPVLQMEHHEVTVDLLHTHFIFTIPSDAAAFFATPIISLQVVLCVHQAPCAPAFASKGSRYMLPPLTSLPSPLPSPPRHWILRFDFCASTRRATPPGSTPGSVDKGRQQRRQMHERPHALAMGAETERGEWSMPITVRAPLPRPSATEARHNRDKAVMPPVFQQQSAMLSAAAASRGMAGAPVPLSAPLPTAAVP